MRHFTIDLSTRQFSQAKDIRKNFFEYNGITDFTYGIKIRKESALYSKVHKSFRDGKKFVTVFKKAA
jgi:hypothetical protein